MTQVDRILSTLGNNSDYPGLTVAQLSRNARVPTDSVRKRIHDLRTEGFRIFTNQRKVRGQNKTYYRMSA